MINPTMMRQSLLAASTYTRGEDYIAVVLVVVVVVVVVTVVVVVVRN